MFGLLRRPALQTGSYSLKVTVSDSAYSTLSNSPTASASISSTAPAMTASPAIDAPLSAMLGPSISTPEGDSNPTLAFTGASAISLVAPSLADVLVSLEVNYGTLSIPSDNLVSSSHQSVNSGQGMQLSIQGTAQAVDAALDSLAFSLPAADLDVSENFGGDYLSINATGFNAGGNALTATTDSVILQMPDDPTLAVPASFAAASGQTLSFNGSNAIVISNQEYPSDTYWVSLTVSDGTFSFAGSTLPAGAFFQPGSNDQSLFLPGTIGELNTDLSALRYTSAAGAADSLTMQVSDESSDNASRYELLNLPINQPSTTGTGSSETLSASITTSGAMTQGSTVTATAAVTGTSSNSSLTYAWTVTAPNGTSVSVGTSATISFTASQVGNYSVLVSVADAPNSVSTAATGEADVATTGGGEVSGGDALTNIGVVRLPTVTENTAAGSGPSTAVASLVDDFGDTLQSANPGFGDVGIAVTYVDASDGSLLYTLDGATWLTVPDVSETNALLLDSNDSIQFVPNAHFIGTLSEAFDFVAWDPLAADSNGNLIASPGQFGDITSGSLASAVSDDGSFASIYVQPVVHISGPGSSPGPATGPGQFTVWTDAPVPNDLLVSVETGASPANPTSDGAFNWSMSSNAPIWGSGTVTVDIEAGQDEATVDVNPGPYNEADGVLADLLSGAVALAPGVSDDTDTYATAGSTFVTVALPSTVPAGSDAAYGGVPAGTPSFNGASADGVDASALVVSAEPSSGSWPQGWTSVSWQTYDGTAVAGVDYGESNGTFTASAGMSASIPIYHNLNAGAETFYIVWTATGPEGEAVLVQPVTFQNPTLTMFGDTNGDGQLTLNDDDPPSDPTLASSTPITVPVVQTDAAAAGSATGFGTIDSVSSNDLVQVWIDAYDGPDATFTLTATGTGTVQAWLNPNETDPIDLTGGTTYTASQIPNWIWINGEQAGNVQLNAVLDLDNALAQAAQPQQGAAPAQGPQAPQPQQVGQAGVNLNATQAAITTVAIGHSAWAFTTAQSAAKITQGGISQSCVVAACGCEALAAGAGALSPQGQIGKAGLPTVGNLAVVPGWVWNPMNYTVQTLPVTWRQMSYKQSIADATPNLATAFAFRRPNGVQLGNGPGEWPATPPIQAGPGAFLADAQTKYQIVMRTFAAGIVKDAITRMIAQGVGSWSVNFDFDPNPPIIISMASFLSTVFGPFVTNGTTLSIGADVKVTFTTQANQLALQITGPNGHSPVAVPTLPPMPWS